MDCGTSLAKYILFLFNTLVSVIGILGIVYGVLLLNSIGMIEVHGQVGFPPQAALPIILISLGSIVVFIAFLGCCGAIRESVCMMMTYSLFLLIMLILQMVIIVFLWLNKDNYKVAMGDIIDQVWANESQHPGIFDAIQKSLKCCGSRGPFDYLTNAGLPRSCCAEGMCLNPLNIYGGCREKFEDLMTGGTENAKIVGIGLIVVELLGFIFACCVANNVRNYKRRNAY